MVRAAEQIEVVDVGRAEIGLDRVGDVGNRHAKLLRLDAVDVDEQLRRVGGKSREHLGQSGSLARGADQFVGRRRQHFGAATLAILDPHGEAAAGADAGHRGRWNYNDEGALDACKPHAQIVGDRASGKPLLVALRRIFEHREQRGGVARLCPRRAREAGECRHANDARRIQRNSLDLTHDLGSACQRGGARQLHRDDDVAAVLCRDEPLWRGHQEPSGAADQSCIDHQHHHRVPDHEIGGAGVAVRQPIEAAIEHAGKGVPAARDEIPARRRPLVLMRLQDQRSQCRRQRQRTETGNRGRNRNGDGKLLKKLPGDAAEECGRDEHRA